MKYATISTKATLGALLLICTLAMKAHAIDAGVYLDASASATPIQEINTSLDLKAGGTTSVKGAQEWKEGEGSQFAATSAASSASISVDSNETSFASSWFVLVKDFFAKLTGFQLDEEIAPIDKPTFLNLRVEEVTSISALINWSPAVFEDVTVYYSTTTPVEAIVTTPHVSPWKFWKRSQVTLHDLAPNTTYFFKAVGENDLGITTAESSFTTSSQ